MADYTDEEQADKPNKPKSENPSGEIIPIADSNTTNQNQGTENMEVHHHAHHNHGKKNWQTYFWEFLMLFLAVFCGFLAEYQLEHKIEGDREEVYIKSMIEDLQKDTTNLALVIKEFQFIDKRLDTVLKMYPKLSKGYNDILHRNLRAAGGYPDFIYSDRTMQQLKNSGAMRLIRNKKVTEGIASYDSKVRDLINIDIIGVNVEFESSRRLMRELFDREDLEKDRQVKSIAQMEMGNKNYLLSSDKALLGEFNNNIRDLKSVYIMIMEKEMILNNDARQLIALMKKEYQLE
ncbi:hypothetical protein [Flavobacterium sp.]|uniref:hypothetical protein n=1 Tax=Flavobacterium sp. TaxID=239 RepID=UPI002B4AD263|nr:hypothetical protein [Flavobacterium sp.]HLF51029.1 hypothetical protein [Flavobacterium sp.]